MTASKMARSVLAVACAAFCVSAADAQILPFLSKRGPAPAVAVPVNPQAQLVAASGSDTVYFSRRGVTLDANAVATLGAQARWLLANPMVSVRIEGHGDRTDTRDYALAIGERRASAVRDFLVLRGIAPERISVVSWGKERPGTARVGPTVVSVGARVVTVVK